MRKFILLLTAFSMPFWANAQELKFGYINAEALMYQLPELSSVETQLADYNAANKKLLEGMQAEIQKEQEVFEKMMTETAKTELEKANQQAKLENLYQRYQLTAQQAQADSQKKQAELLKPLYDKVIKAIEDVSKKNNLFMVLDEGSVLYKTDKTSDITPLVKKELGLQ
jgi:outer membrane protein